MMMEFIGSFSLNLQALFFLIQCMYLPANYSLAASITRPALQRSEGTTNKKTLIYVVWSSNCSHFLSIIDKFSDFNWSILFCKEERHTQKIQSRRFQKHPANISPFCIHTLPISNCFWSNGIHRKDVHRRASR